MAIYQQVSLSQAVKSAMNSKEYQGEVGVPAFKPSSSTEGVHLGSAAFPVAVLGEGLSNAAFSTENSPFSHFALSSSDTLHGGLENASEHTNTIMEQLQHSTSINPYQASADDSMTQQNPETDPISNTPVSGSETPHVSTESMTMTGGESSQSSDATQGGDAAHGEATPGEAIADDSGLTLNEGLATVSPGEASPTQTESTPSEGAAGGDETGGGGGGKEHESQGDAHKSEQGKEHEAKGDEHGKSDEGKEHEAKGDEHGKSDEGKEHEAKGDEHDKSQESKEHEAKGDEHGKSHGGKEHEAKGDEHDKSHGQEHAHSKGEGHDEHGHGEHDQFSAETSGGKGHGGQDEGKEGGGGSEHEYAFGNEHVHDVDPNNYGDQDHGHGSQAGGHGGHDTTAFDYHSGDAGGGDVQVDHPADGGGGHHHDGG